MRDLSSTEISAIHATIVCDGLNNSELWDLSFTIETNSNAKELAFYEKVSSLFILNDGQLMTPEARGTVLQILLGMLT